MRVYAGVCMLTSAVTRSCSVSSASAVKRVANFVTIRAPRCPHCAFPTQCRQIAARGAGAREGDAGVCKLTSAVTASRSVSSASAVKRVANFVIIIRVCPDALTVCISDTMQAL